MRYFLRVRVGLKLGVTNLMLFHSALRIELGHLPSRVRCSCLYSSSLYTLVQFNHDPCCLDRE